MKLADKKKLAELVRRNAEITKLRNEFNSELAEFGRSLNPFKHGDIITRGDGTRKYKVFSATGVLEEPGYYLLVHEIGTSGRPLQSSRHLPVRKDQPFRLTEAPTRPVSKTQKALNAALALLSPKKAAQLKKEHGV